MEPQPVDDRVDGLALGAKGDADEIEIFGGDGRDGGPVRLVATASLSEEIIESISSSLIVRPGRWRTLSSNVETR